MLIVTGPSCSGKTTFGRMARAKGIVVIETTDIVKEVFRETARLGEDIIEFCVRTYQEEGEEVFAELNYDRIIQTGLEPASLVLVGVRAAGEVEYFRRRVSATTVIGIYADTTSRYERCLIRDRQDCAKNIQEFIRRDMREYAMGLARLFSGTLDFLMLNNGTLADFEMKVHSELHRVFAL